MTQLSSRLQTALQTQMKREIVAALVYKQMRCDLRLASWWGFHKFMHASEDEEFGHARDFDHYLTERGVRPVYDQIQIPNIPFTPDAPIQYFEAALKLENLYWEYLNELYQLSEDEDDPDTCDFLYKKITDQHDSVDGLNHIIQKMKRAGTDIAALQALDDEVKDIAKKK